MVDWPGLLKWSLKYQDTPSAPKDFKPMDEATRKWLEEAIKSYSLDHISRMKEIIATFSSENTMILLEELSDLIENLDAGLIFCQLEGMPGLLKLIFSHKDVKIRLLAARILQSIVQNSKENQIFAEKAGAMRIIESVLNEKDIENREACFSALSALIRGEALAIKTEFLLIDGMEFLKKIAEEMKDSEKIRVKMMFLIRDLVFYDEVLEGKFKGIVKKKVKELGFLELFEEVLQEKEKKKEFIEGRIAVGFVIGEMKKGLEKGKWLEVITKHLKGIEEENKKEAGLFDNEIVIFKELYKEFEKL